MARWERSELSKWERSDLARWERSELSRWDLYTIYNAATCRERELFENRFSVAPETRDIDRPANHLPFFLYLNLYFITNE